ncbi:hypothetical protein MPSEU_001078300 [Mayamaea pseudoterrestris]|nr:hypothetical protein MPSEU_001078300 [Mayamaea pseudoterrestris]
MSLRENGLAISTSEDAKINFADDKDIVLGKTMNMPREQEVQFMPLSVDDDDHEEIYEEQDFNEEDEDSQQLNKHQQQSPAHSLQHTAMTVSIYVIIFLLGLATIHLVPGNRSSKQKAMLQSFIDNETLSDLQDEQQQQLLLSFYNETSHDFSLYMNLTNNDDRIVYVNEHVQNLLSFAVIAHSKCGTSFLQNRLYQHPQVGIHRHEIHHVQHYHIANMVEALLDLDDPNQMVSIYGHAARRKKQILVRGYKAPNDIRRPNALEAIRTYWPKTKLVVGLRHPIKHFQSYYNYNTERGKPPSVPPQDMYNRYLPEELFHVNLFLLGKTASAINTFNSSSDKDFTQLLRKHYRWAHYHPPTYMPNPVFLYELGQMSYAKDDHDVRFAADLQNYLGLTEPFNWGGRKAAFATMGTNSSTSAVPSANGTRRGLRIQRRITPSGINICDPLYDKVRANLLVLGAQASQWIQSHFMNHADVRIYNREHFIELLNAWAVDPCDDETRQYKQQHRH